MKSYIYFLTAGEGGPIKIGKTKDIINRISVLQTGNHVELILLRLSRGNRNDEKMWHEKYDYLKIRGEWFAPDENILKEIYKLDIALANSYNKSKINTKCQVCNEKFRRHIREAGPGKFESFCTACLMRFDGRLAKLRNRLVPSRKIKPPEACSNCGFKSKYMRKGLCSSCNEYLRRNGTQRPADLCVKEIELPPCLDCQKERDDTRFIKGSCWTCYQKKRRKKKDPRTPCSSCNMKEDFLENGLCRICRNYLGENIHGDSKLPCLKCKKKRDSSQFVKRLCLKCYKLENQKIRRLKKRSIQHDI